VRNIASSSQDMTGILRLSKEKRLRI